jgi:hypothetical protein
MRTPIAVAIGFMLAGARRGRVAVAADIAPAMMPAPVATASAAPATTPAAARPRWSRRPPRPRPH